MITKEIIFRVCVRCSTFNHSAYIKEAMDGFCMQQTKFPFVCCIIDDCSTDGEQEVISHYLSDHFEIDNNSLTTREETEDYRLISTRHKENANCHFVVLFLKYNHYRKKSKASYIKRWLEASHYHAYCEGDDYWIDCLKLQKQVDALDSHPDYTMICNRSLLFSQKAKKIIGENYCYNKSQVIDPIDVLNRGALSISMCSVLYRPEVRKNYPDYCRKLFGSDAPLHLLASMKGKIYYFNEPMSVYRVDNSESFMGKAKWSNDNLEHKINLVWSSINMYKGFANEFYQYRKVYLNKIGSQISRYFPGKHINKEIRKIYKDTFKNEIKKYPLLWRFDFLLRSSNLHPRIVSTIRYLYIRKYTQKIKYY